MAFVCDLVAMTQRVEVCELYDDAGVRIDMTYRFGTPGKVADLQFSTHEAWGTAHFEGYVEIPDLLGWNIGAVHPNGTVYGIYAYGRYDDNHIRRAVLQVYPSVDDFNKSRRAIFHAECIPETARSDDFSEFFRP